MRRRLKEAYRLSESGLTPGFDIVIVARQGCFDADFAELERDLARLYGKLAAACAADGQAYRPGQGARRRAGRGKR
jgi:RNase P protein component